METKERTAKETAKIVEKTIKTIYRVTDAVPVMSGYDWFSEDEFRNGGLDDLVRAICEENGISEEYIRKVACL